MNPREFDLLLIDAEPAVAFVAFLTGKVQRSHEGYVPPDWARVTVEQDAKRQMIWVKAVVPDAWTSEISAHLRELVAQRQVVRED